MGELNCLVRWTGTVTCVPPSAQTALCTPNLRHYPFDEQNCSLHYGSWTDVGEEVNFAIKNKSVNMNQLSPNPEWTVLGMRAIKHVYQSNNYTFPIVEISFAIRRQATTVVAMSVVPSLGLYTRLLLQIHSASLF